MSWFILQCREGQENLASSHPEILREELQEFRKIGKVLEEQGYLIWVYREGAPCGMQYRP